MIHPIPPILQVDKDSYLISIGTLQLTADRKFILNLFHAARRALNFNL